MTTKVTALHELFSQLWRQFIAITPSAKQIHQLLGEESGGDIINDHIALRTFNHPKINLNKIAYHFEKHGYQACGDYEFKAKKLKAKHYEHFDPTMPKVFISELLLEEFSPELQAIVEKLVSCIDNVNQEDFVYSGRHWQLSYEEYQALLAESEYAAWLAAWGFRANHFTVSVNHLKNFVTLAEVNDTLKQAGFNLNLAGGEIKGSKDVFLEQSATLADESLVQFADKEASIPSCFYEFAMRYPTQAGNLYSGFVTSSADKIFESTNN